MKRVLSIVIIVGMLIMALPCAVATEAAGVMKVGSKGDDVRQLQSRLIELGFLIGSADGDFGERTKSAVIAFQEHLLTLGYEVTVDGKVGQQTKAFIYTKDDKLKAPLLTIGSRGERVIQLQSRLIKLILIEGAPDGVFGKQTQAAVIEFQQAMVDAGLNNAQVTGAADRFTLETLYSIPDSVKLHLPAGLLETQPLALTERDLYAGNCILLDAATGQTLFEKNADERCYPASTTKILTLLLAVEHGGLNKTITVPASAGEVPWDSSIVPVYPEEVMPFKDLLYGLIIRSGNDAANAIATIVSGDIPSFVKAMNKKAKAIGMTSTHFANPHGYHDDNHYTTARDMGLLTLTALKNDKARAILTAKSYTMSPTVNREALVISSGYEILNPASASYYPYAYGIKTGYTSKSWHCYVGAAEKDGMSLVAVVMHSGVQREFKWQDAKNLFNYGFAVLEQR